MSKKPHTESNLSSTVRLPPSLRQVYTHTGYMCAHIWNKQEKKSHKWKNLTLFSKTDICLLRFTNTPTPSLSLYSSLDTDTHSMHRALLNPSSAACNKFSGEKPALHSVPLRSPKAAARTATSLIWWSDDFFYTAVFLMKMQLSDLGNRWFGENFITLPLTTTWVEHDIHNCCQNQLVAARYREHIRSSNWNGLQSGRDGGIHSEQISSILLAVCKQLLINNIVTVWRQMTPRLQKNTHTRCLGVGKLPSASAQLTHSQIWL